MSEANNNPATNCQQKGRAVAVDMGTTNQPSVGAAQWAGLGEQCTVLHSPDTAPNDNRSRAAECRRGSAQGNDLSVNYVTNISCVTTSHQHRLQWTLDILHISCLNPSHSL